MKCMSVNCNNMSKLGSMFCSPCAEAIHKNASTERRNAEIVKLIEAIEYPDIRDALMAIFEIIQNKD